MRDLRCLFHEDDYATVGWLENLAWLRGGIEGEFDTTTIVVGRSSGADVASEGHILHRIPRAVSAGWEYECDQRHVEVLIEELELTALKSVSTPGVAEAVDKSQVGAAIADDDLDSVPLVGESATRYRTFAARCNYIALDTADAQYCIKELCRDMRSPTVAS